MARIFRFLSSTPELRRASTTGDLELSDPTTTATPAFRMGQSAKARPLMLVDAQRTIQNVYRKARLILSETARLQMPFMHRLVRRRIVLTGDALLLDKNLARLDSEPVYNGIGEIDGFASEWEQLIYRDAMEDQKVKVQIDEFTRACRGVEKEVRDTILTELRDGMVDTKKVIGHRALLERLNDLHGTLKQAHLEVFMAIEQTKERLMASQSSAMRS